jgi:hypothetical protein
MIASKSQLGAVNGKPLEPRTLDAYSTREFLETSLLKSFDPDLKLPARLNPVETARFIAEQTRKLRLAAIWSGQANLVWMIENIYYEAYSTGCVKTGMKENTSSNDTLSS